MIHIRLNSLPMSANNAYFNLPHGGRALTKEGKKYKAETINHIIKNHGLQTQEIKPNVAIGIVIALGFPNLLNRGYPKRSDNKFKKLDLDNHIKLLQDTLKEAMHMDDSQVMVLLPYKYQAKSEETQIWIWNEEEEHAGARLLGAFAEIVRSPVSV